MKSVVWGDKVIDAGFVQVPNILLEHQHELDISNDEFMLIVHVLKYKHTAEDPYPRNSTIAERMQCSERTLQRYIASLKDKGFLERHQVNEWTYTWDFSLLLNRLRGMSGGGDENGTRVVQEVLPPPGDKSVTQKYTQLRSKQKEVESNAHTRKEEVEEKEEDKSLPIVDKKGNPIPVSSSGEMLLSDAKPASQSQRRFIQQLLDEKDIPEARRKFIQEWIDDTQQILSSETASDFISELRNLGKRSEHPEGPPPPKKWEGLPPPDPEAAKNGMCQLNKALKEATYSTG